VRGTLQHSSAAVATKLRHMPHAPQRAQTMRAAAFAGPGLSHTFVARGAGTPAGASRPARPRSPSRRSRSLRHPHPPHPAPLPPPARASRGCHRSPRSSRTARAAAGGALRRRSASPPLPRRQRRAGCGTRSRSTGRRVSPARPPAGAFPRARCRQEGRPARCAPLAGRRRRAGNRGARAPRVARDGTTGASRAEVDVLASLL